MGHPNASTIGYSFRLCFILAAGLSPQAASLKPGFAKLRRLASRYPGLSQVTQVYFRANLIWYVERLAELESAGRPATTKETDPRLPPAPPMPKNICYSALRHGPRRQAYSCDLSIRRTSSMKSPKTLCCFRRQFETSGQLDLLEAGKIPGVLG